MQRSGFKICLFLLVLAGGLGHAQQDDPLDSDVTEKVDVRLVLVDAIVVDKRGRTVPDLTAEDFLLSVNGKAVPVDTLDVSCAEGALDDPIGRMNPGKRKPLAEAERLIVIVVDYLHLVQFQRADVLEQAQRMVRLNAGPGDQVMVVALTGGLRIEQPFTDDMAEVEASLKRMEYDISLWAPAFAHMTEKALFRSLEALMDLLERYEAPKALVMYSTAERGGTDLQYENLAAAATASRSSFYPVDAAGMRTLIRGVESQAGHG